MSQAGVGIRLFMAGAELVKQTFAQIGDAGKRMWAAIAIGDEKANPALKGLSQASKEAQRALADVAANGGAASRVLIAMGPAGLAAAAGIGAAVLALRTLITVGFASIEQLAKLNDAAAGLNVGVDFAVRYGLALQKAGGEQEKLLTGLDAFQKKWGAADAGLDGGNSPFDKALAQIGLDENDLRRAKDTEGQLILIAGAISQIDSAAERAAIADKLGLGDLLPLLEKGAEQTQELANEYRGLGDQTAAAAKEAGPLAQRINDASAKMKAATDVITGEGGLGAALVYLKEVAADALAVVANLLGGNIGQGLEDRIKEATARIDKLRRLQSDPSQFTAGELLGGSSASLQWSEARLALMEAVQGLTRPNTFPVATLGVPKLKLTLPEADTASPGKAAAAEAAAQRDLEAATKALDASLEKARGALGAYLGDLGALEKLSAKLPGRQADIREAMEGAGKTYIEAAAKAAGLDKGLEALEKRDPAALKRYLGELTDLAAQRDAYPGGADAFAAALDKETKAILLAADGAQRATQARGDFDALMKGLRTPGERADDDRADQISAVNRARAAAVITDAQAADALARIAKRYDDVATASTGAAQAGQGWMTLLDGMTNKAAGLTDTVIELIKQLLQLTAINMKGGGGFWSALGDAAGQLFGFGGGGGGGLFGGGLSGAGAGGVGAGIFGAIHHTGYGPGDPVTMRRFVPDWVWSGAPRHHEGYLAPHERAAIITRDESVLTPGQMRAVYGRGAADAAAANEAMRASLLVTIRDETNGRIQTEQSEGPNGMQLDLLVRDSTRGSLTNGDFDAAMAQRYGIKPRTL